MMKDSRDMLSSTLKNAQLGQSGIRSVLDLGICPGLRGTLEAQLLEYVRIESEVHAIASQRGWELTELDPGIRLLVAMKARLRLVCGNDNSRIAGMMIQGSTRSLIRGYQQLHRYPRQDDRISSISQKLIDCETAAIWQLQAFL